MTNQIRKVETKESSNLLQLLPEKVYRYKATFNSLALGVLLSTGVASNEAKAADSFENLAEAKSWYYGLNKKVNKLTDRVEYLEEYADKNNATEKQQDEKIQALELEMDQLKRHTSSYIENTEINKNNIYSSKVDLKIGDKIIDTGAKIESSKIKGSQIKIDSITDKYGNKYTFSNTWLDRKYFDMDR